MNIHVVLAPDQWRGEGPPGQVAMQIIRDRIAATDDPEWAAVEGWRYFPDDPESLSSLGAGAGRRAAAGGTARWCVVSIHADVTIPAGQWHGVAVGTELFPEPASELVIEPTGVMAGVRPGWLTVTGWRRLPGEHNREMVIAQVDADALPEEQRPHPGGAW